jgi:hypothetical protein
MRTYITEFKAVNVKTGELETYSGERVESLTKRMAQGWCNRNAPYLRVVGELVAEIFEEDDIVDYSIQQDN